MGSGLRGEILTVKDMWTRSGRVGYQVCYKWKEGNLIDYCPDKGRVKSGSQWRVSEMGQMADRPVWGVQKLLEALRVQPD